MSEWQDVVIEDLCSEITDCVNKTAPSVDYVTPYKMIRTTNIKQGRINLDEVRYVTEETYNTWIRRGAPQLEDIILTREAPVGEVGMIRTLEKVFLGQRTMMYRADRTKADPYFLYYAFQTEAVQEQIHSAGMGSVVEHVRVPDAKKFKISTPPLSEQKAIASVLSSLDDKIDLLHRQNKTLEAMAETLFRQWFIEEAKEDWEKVTLGDIVNITSSKRIFYSEYVDEGIPFYRSKEIIELNKSGQTRSELFISNERFDGIVAKFGAPVEGDILLTSVGTLGVTYQVKASDRFYFKDGNLTWFKDFKHISSNIIFCWLNSKNGKEQLDNISIGSTQAALTIQGLKSLELSLPSLNVIQKLDEQLVVIYQKVNANQSQIQTLEKLRDTLLPKLMSGEVRVQYQTAEVA